jgi:hypothetical protein
VPNSCGNIYLEFKQSEIRFFFREGLFKNLFFRFTLMTSIAIGLSLVKPRLCQNSHDHCVRVDVGKMKKVVVSGKV